MSVLGLVTGFTAFELSRETSVPPRPQYVTRMRLSASPRCLVWCTTIAFLCHLIFARTAAFAVPFAAQKGVALKLSPLVGGPSWLPVHVKVVVHNEHVWDFLPLEPTAPETLKKLFSFEPVPARVRYSGKPVKSDEFSRQREDLTVMAAEEFADSYPEELHLIRNNCWTFALALAWHLQMSRNQKPWNP